MKYFCRYQLSVVVGEVGKIECGRVRDTMLNAILYQCSVCVYGGAYRKMPPYHTVRRGDMLFLSQITNRVYGKPYNSHVVAYIDE